MTQAPFSKHKVVSKVYEIDEGGYEYRVKLVDQTEEAVISEWDSLHECYNGGGHLTKANAEATIKQIETDVQEGDANLWFDV